MHRQNIVLKLLFSIGVLQASITLVTGKCNGVCVKLDECDNDFGGVNFVNLRFGEEDYVEADCPHYLEVCCDAENVVTTRAPPVAGGNDSKDSGSSEERERDQKPPKSENYNAGQNSGNPDNAGQDWENPDHVGNRDNADGNSGNPDNADNDLGNADNNNQNLGNQDNAGHNLGNPDNTDQNVGNSDNSGLLTGEGGSANDSGLRSVFKPFGECGIRNPTGVGFRVTNTPHNETQFGEFPWMVAVLQNQEVLDESVSSYACGGSLIAPNVVLTVAHCVMDKEAQTLTARAGEWDTMTKNELIPHQDRRVSRIILHPNFNRNLLFHNLALLVLEESFSAADNVQLACLPPQAMVFDEHDCLAAGWGKTAFDAKSYHAVLKRIPVPMVSHPTCQSALRTTRLGPKFRLHESFVCAGGEEGIDACTGDGGSPLVCPVDGVENKYYQAGIVAWGINCGQSGIPGVYVRASLYTKWIEKQLETINFMSVDRRNSV